MLIVYFVLGICIPHAFEAKWTSYEAYDDWRHSELIPNRIIELMMSYGHRAKLRVDEVHQYRSKYELSPHFEFGYIMSELMERYSKIVENAKRPVEYLSDTVYDALKHCDFNQKLFFEVYHLVNMAHEIPKKYGHMPEFSDQSPTVHDRESVENAIKRMEVIQKQRQKERKVFMKHILMERNLNELSKTGGIRKLRRPKNKWWPIDYGWEIDYQWW